MARMRSSCLPESCMGRQRSPFLPPPPPPSSLHKSRVLCYGGVCAAFYEVQEVQHACVPTSGSSSCAANMELNCGHATQQACTMVKGGDAPECPRMQNAAKGSGGDGVAERCAEMPEMRVYGVVVRRSRNAARRVRGGR